MPRIVDRTARRAQISAAAARVFAERGVAKTSVSDIVKAAGVAQGTFYLYFATKDDVVLAVVDEMAGRMIDGIASAVDASGSTAVEKFLALRDVFMAFDVDPTAIELADFMHRPENRALHDRMAEHFVPALIPLMESIVVQGVAEGVFNVRDPRAAAWFVLGGLRSVELAETPVEHMPAAIAAVTDLALRALGYQERTA
jgi:TetR/AcrR family fatty acid metabolism transcriptional regulator